MEISVIIKLCVVAIATIALCSEGKKIRKKHADRKYSGKCKPHVVAEYELAFHGAWSETNYPRMYPKYRPKAQWSKLIGK